FPMWRELDHALDVIEAKTIACKLLIEGHGPHTLQPGDTSDWDQIFETTWRVPRPVKRDSAPEYL
ncbi:MAG: hypothetical protein O7B26_14130, partial [Planctomycetota bacterium]|nr:hypothetical protein [Planctomycetota bacterium]